MKTTKRVELQLPPEVYAAASALAQRQGLPLAAWIRVQIVATISGRERQTEERP